MEWPVRRCKKLGMLVNYRHISVGPASSTMLCIHTSMLSVCKTIVSQCVCVCGVLRDTCIWEACIVTSESHPNACSVDRLGRAVVHVNQNSFKHPRTTALPFVFPWLSSDETQCQAPATKWQTLQQSQFTSITSW